MNIIKDRELYDLVGTKSNVIDFTTFFLKMMKFCNKYISFGIISREIILIKWLKILLLIELTLSLP